MNRWGIGVNTNKGDYHDCWCNLTASGGALYLNESGSAVTSDATGVLTVSGEITIILAALGDN